MAFIPQDGKGRLFDRTVDKTKDTQADYVGTAMYNGQHMRISAWRYPPNERNRVATMSLSIESEKEYQEKMAAKRAKKAQDDAAEHGQPPAPDPGDQSDIPF